MYINCLFSLKVLCLYQLMALRKTKIYIMVCRVKEIVWKCSRDWLVVCWLVDIDCKLLTMVYELWRYVGWKEGWREGRKDGRKEWMKEGRKEIIRILHSEDRASCYVITIKANNCTISQLYFGKELNIFRTDLLSIIRSLNNVFTATGICHTS